MLRFTLAISCLTILILPWFMDLTFQVPMQYCSLQHWTLLLPLVTSTNGCCSCFGSIHSFFLVLFLYWSPVAYWAPSDLGSSSLSVLSFCLFTLLMDRSWWRGLTECGPQEKGMANLFSILALRTPWTVWTNRQADAIGRNWMKEI